MAAIDFPYRGLKLLLKTRSSLNRMQHESQALFKACIRTYLMAIFSLFWFIIMKKPIPKKIDLTEEDANQLIERINASNLSCDDIKIVVGVIHFCL